MKHRVPLVLAGAALAAAALSAQDVHFGLAAGLSLPTGDLKTYTDNRTGFSLGAHALVDLGDGHTLRPRLDYTSFSEKTGFYKLAQTAFSVDYLYFMNGKPNEGVYLGAGLGLASNKYSASNLDYDPPTYNRTNTKPVFTVTAGYQFNDQWGAELRYHGSRFTDEYDTTTSVNFITAAATFRF